MKNEHPVEDLSAYMDGALEPVETEALERHLAGCASCSRLLDDLRTLEAAHEEPPPVPAGLQRRIAASLGPAPVDRPVPPSRHRGWRLRGIPLAAAASMAAVAILAVLFIAEPERMSRPDLIRREVNAPGGESIGPPESSAGQTRDDRDTGEPSIGNVGHDERKPGAKGSEGKTSRAGPLPEAGAAGPGGPEPEQPAPRQLKEPASEQPASPALAPAPPPATLSNEAAGKKEAAPSDKDEARPGLGVLSSSRARGASVAEQEQRAARTIVVEDPSFTITLAETGLMRITAGEYDCTVPAPEEAGPAIASLFESGAGRAGPGRRARILALLDGAIRDRFRDQCGSLPEALAKTR